MLNLDTEEEGHVYIGCAGGSDIIATKAMHRKKIDEEVNSYEVIVDHLPGGHSGVDIHKNIPSALKELAAFLVHIPHYLIEIEGGERRNSIPKRARAVISVPLGVILDTQLDQERDHLAGNIEIKRLGKSEEMMIDQGHRISEMIHALSLIHI